MSAVLLMAAVLSLVGVGLLLPLLRRAQVIDVPNARSSHRSPIPRGGGAAVVAAFLMATLVGRALGSEVSWALIAAVVAVAVVGLIEDVRGIEVGVRLALQLILATGLAAAVLSGQDVSVAIVLAAAVCIAGYTNAFNFMDGVNGISALNAGLAGGWFAFLGQVHALDALTTLGLALAGAALGFLPWNAPRARVFLGDVGSYGLGLAVVGCALLAWVGGVPLVLAGAPLTVYVADTGWAVLKRVQGRRSWREAHREHVYQRLTDAGWTHLASGALPAAFAAMVCGLALWVEPLPLLLPAVAVAVLLYLSAPRFVARDGARQEMRTR